MATEGEGRKGERGYQEESKNEAGRGVATSVGSWEAMKNVCGREGEVRKKKQKTRDIPGGIHYK